MWKHYYDTVQCAICSPIEICIFENKDFNKGTFGIAESLSISSAFTLVGGGDSVSAVKQAELSEKMSHVSTGGGASLEFIEQGNLPGIQALKYGVSI